jgi:hypothetical protein
LNSDRFGMVLIRRRRALSDTSAHREGAAKGPRKVCTYLSSQFVLNSEAIVFEADFRRPDDNDDADRQALASMRLRSVY